MRARLEVGFLAFAMPGRNLKSLLITDVGADTSALPDIDREVFEAFLNAAWNVKATDLEQVAARAGLSTSDAAESILRLEAAGLLKLT